MRQTVYATNRDWENNNGTVGREGERERKQLKVVITQPMVSATSVFMFFPLSPYIQLAAVFCSWS